MHKHTVPSAVPQTLLRPILISNPATTTKNFLIEFSCLYDNHFIVFHYWNYTLLCITFFCYICHGLVPIWKKIDRCILTDVFCGVWTWPNDGLMFYRQKYEWKHTNAPISCTSSGMWRKPLPLNRKQTSVMMQMISSRWLDTINVSRVPYSNIPPNNYLTETITHSGRLWSSHKAQKNELCIS